MIKKETIEMVLDAARIEEVVGEFVDLKKRGTSLIGNCPFHNEKTPSFHVSVSKGIYKCFGCSAGGDSLKFVMEHEKYSYPEAIRYLANKYGIPVEEEQVSQEQQQVQGKRESLYILSKWAGRYFAQQLLETEQGRNIGLSYFHERGYHEETIRKFELGYSPENWTALVDSAKREGHSVEYLLEAGLAIEREDGSLYDRFRARVIFPIHNLTGRVIGFGARTLKTDKKVPKYVNSPESDIYHKSNVLYGIHLAKRAIVDSDACYLVEGYADVISCHQAGVENVVASSGTSLTTGQIKLIRRFTRNVVILYDGDQAGIKASIRGTEMLLEEGMNVKVLLFPDGNDPDSYIQKHGPSSFRAYLEKNEEDFVFYMTRVLLGEAGHDPIKRSEVIREVVKSISLIPDEIKVSVYIQQCSSLLQIEERVLLTELNKMRLERAKNVSKSAQGPSVESNSQIPDDEFIPAEMLAAMESQGVLPPKPGNPESSEVLMERELVRVLLNYGREQVTWEGDAELPVAPYLLASLEDITLSDQVSRRIVEEFRAHSERFEVPEARYFFSHADPLVAKMAIDCLANRYEVSPNWNDDKRKIFVPQERDQLKELVVQLIYRMKKIKVEVEMDRFREEIKAEQDPANLQILLDKYQKLKEAEKLLGGLLGNTVIK